MNKVEESKVKVMDSESEKLYKRYVALKKQLEELYKVSDGELFNFYKKYTALKAEIKDLEKELEAYKVEALDKDGPTYV